MSGTKRFAGGEAPADGPPAVTAIRAPEIVGWMVVGAAGDPSGLVRVGPSRAARTSRRLSPSTGCASEFVEVTGEWQSR